MATQSVAGTAPPDGDSNTITIDTRSDELRSLILRTSATVSIVALIGAYSFGVISGAILDTQRIDTTHLILILIAAVIAAVLVRPQLLEQLKRVKLSSFEIEMLEKVKEKQTVQENQIEDIRLMLPLLIPEAERRHLLNLADRKSSGYKGKHSLRTELRRLRSIGLLRMRNDHHVSHIKDDLVVDLSEYVELTPFAERWIRRIREIEEQTAKDDVAKP